MPKSPRRKVRRVAAPAPASAVPTRAPVSKRRGRPRTVAPVPPAPAESDEAASSSSPVLEVNQDPSFAMNTSVDAGECGPNCFGDNEGVSLVAGTAMSKVDAVDPTRPIPIFSVTSKLGYHVPQLTKEKIWAGAYVDLVPLLNDFTHGVAVRTDRQSQYMLALDGDSVVLRQPGPSRKRLESFGMWQSAFHTFMSIYLAKHTSRFAELLKYCEIVRTASLQFVGFGWRVYDEQFRLKQEINPSRSWAEIDMELWVTVMGVPMTSQGFRPSGASLAALTPSSQNKMGHCFAYNSIQGCHYTGCKYSHSCTHCFRPGHGASRCTFVTRAFTASNRHRQPSNTRPSVQDKPGPLTTNQGTPATVAQPGKRHSFRHSNAN